MEKALHEVEKTVCSLPPQCLRWVWVQEAGFPRYNASFHLFKLSKIPAAKWNLLTRLTVTLKYVHIEPFSRELTIGYHPAARVTKL